MRPRGTIIGLLGIWTIVAALWGFAPIGEVWSDLFTGIIVAILGFSLTPGMRGHRWVNGIAGLWMIVSAFIPGFHAGTPLLVNKIISGIVLMVAGFTLPAGPGHADTSVRAA